MRNWTVGILTCFLLGSCSTEENTNSLFTLMPDTGIKFVNELTDTKDFNIFSYRNFYNGGGCAIGDINNDGLKDVLFTSNMGENKLYLNKGNWQFEDITDIAGIGEKNKWSTGVVMVDINADGLLDIYICNAGYQKGMRQENSLFINKGNLRFEEAAKEYGLDNDGYTTHAAFFDYDLDGDLDCYLLNNSFIPVNTLNYSNKRELRARDWPVADFLKGGGSYLLRNDGGKFTDVSEEAGIYGSLISFGLGVTVGDVNGDGYPDIYVSNDFFERDYLYINNQKGGFTEELESRMGHISHSSMGADMADINNDGLPDIFVTEMLPDDEYRLKTTTTFEQIEVKLLKQRSGFYNQYMQNTLQVNRGDGIFLETGYYSGVAASDWSWGGLLFDADNDGKNDLFIANGIFRDVTDQDFINFFANEVIQQMVLTGQKEEVDQIISKMPSRPISNKMFRNAGQWRFEAVEKQWGLSSASFSNGAAFGDLDNDGDLDLIVNNVNQRAFVYRNNAKELGGNNSIGFVLQDTGQNRNAIGAKIILYQGNEKQMRELVPSRGFQSSVDYTLHFGLGDKLIDSAVVIWPGGYRESIQSWTVNQVNTIRRGENGTMLIAQQTSLSDPAGSNSKKVNAKTDRTTAFVFVDSTQLDPHVEDSYIDFYNERYILSMISREGPKIAKADVNRDGLEDIYIAGAAHQAGQLYLQTPNGFRKSNQSIFEAYKEWEDIAPLFFDADQDGDADLFIVSGGNHQTRNTKFFSHRLYLNDGKGDFSASPHALPANESNCSVVLPLDIDGDGDLDLFIGGRSIPLQYGPPASSQLLINKGDGVFELYLDNGNNPLLEVGLITGAVWANVTGDASKELVLAGEWMDPVVFEWKNGKLLRVENFMKGYAGWWQSIAAADLNGDGYDELILGNIGDNFYLRADSAHPVKMWINDFDGNSDPEEIITRTIDGKDMTVFMKRELTEQVPLLKKQNLRNEQFATRSIGDLFPRKLLDQALLLQVNYTKSCIVYTGREGVQQVEPLDFRVQLSSVNAIHVTDINKDGLPDLVLGGNMYSFQPQFGQLDASFGHVLLNEKNGLKYLSPLETGLDVQGAIRDFATINTKTGRRLIVVRNNERQLIFSY
ncbi:MAG TPA: FG-GAP-like repeat-containing protein [Flavihumibacter sp.]